MRESLKHIALGAVGGLAGTAVMRWYWQAATALAGEDPRGWTQDGAPHALDEMSVAGQHHEEGESSTAAVGRILYTAYTGEAPPAESKTKLSYAVHWAYGTAMGGLYGALRGPQDTVDAAGGLVFGTALWLLGDELMVPLLGLSKGATAFPLAQHAHRLGAHLAYGLVVAATTQAGHALLRSKNDVSPSRSSWTNFARDYLKGRSVKGRAGRQAVTRLVDALRSQGKQRWV